MYDTENLNDDVEYDQMSIGERLAAEEDMRRRDRELGLGTGRMRHGLLYGMSDCGS